MRILIDGESIEGKRTGIGNYTYSLLKAMSNLDDLPEVFIGIKTGTEINANEFGSIKEFALDKRRYKYLPIDLLGISKSFDIYHEPNYIPRPFKGTTIVNIYDMSYRLYPQYHPWRRVTLLKTFESRMKKANKIITVSENAKNEIIDLLKVEEDRVVVVYPGVSEKFHKMVLYEDQILNMRDRYKLPEEFILYVGTIEPRKNLVRLIEAFEQSKKIMKDAQLKLVLAGGKGWLYENIYRRVQELEMSEDVIFTGYVEDEHLPVLYNMATAFIYPSLYEGFGIPPLEAMASGVPVICSNVSSIPEVVKDAGILINPYNVNELTKAIVKVIKSKSLREELSYKGLSQAKTFSWERCASETLKIYKDLLRF